MTTRRWLLILAIAACASAALPSPAASGARPQVSTTGPGAERVREAIDVLKDMTDLTKPEEKIPAWLLRKAEGLAVFPGVIKAAYGVGGQYGRGIVLARTESGAWSAPVFASLVGGSLGWQIGVQKADIVLVFKSRRGMDGIVRGDITLGADVSVVAGPAGRSAEAGTDLEMEAEIYSYSKSKGLFAGVSVKGSSIRVDRDAISAFYGRDDLAPGEILAGRPAGVPPVVESLWEVLKRLPGR